ncbi:hypothetical protein ACP275_02G026000 [Erythranthe tilingii]
MWSIEIYIVGFVIVLVTHLIIIYRWRNPKCNGKLPPGSLGFPFIGECFELIFPAHSYDLHPFIKKRLQRYGPLFRTNIAGRNVVVSADQEFNNFIFQQEDKSVVRWYLDSFVKLFEQSAEVTSNGLSLHKHMRSTVLTSFGIESINRNLLFRFEKLVRRTLHSWSTQDQIDAEYATIAMFGEFGVDLLCSYDAETSKELIDKYINTTSAVMSFPLNIPGTTYHKSLKNKEKVMEMLREAVNARLALQRDDKDDDLISKMIKDINIVDFVTPEYIAQILFGLLFTMFQTLPLLLVFILKFISENPAVVGELIVSNPNSILIRPFFFFFFFEYFVLIFVNL